MHRPRQLFAYLLLIGLLASLQGVAVAAERPNVLFIAADDLNCSLGCYGQPDVSSPKLDELASRGTLFQRAYCQQAVCNPSRASLMTGLRPDTIGVWDLRTHFRNAVPDATTIPQHFKNHGYFTRGIGKLFHNMGNLNDTRSWSVPSVLHEGRHSDTYQITPPDWKPGQKRGALERADLPDNAYRDGQIADLACQQLREFGERPFFLAVGFWRPHLPFLAPNAYWERYDAQTLTLPTVFAAPDDVPSIALHDSRELRSYGPDPQQLTATQRRELWHGYYASISYLDAQVGKLLATLRELNLERNTIVVFWSDHGFHLGQHALWCKTSCFERDARVPLIFAGPGIESGQSRQEIVELIDLLPTLSELCGLPQPHVEGESLVPLLQGGLPRSSDQDGMSFAITQHPRPAYYKGQPEAMGYSFRTNAFRYTEWRDWETKEILGRELYDHRSDPEELKNVIGEQQHQAAVDALAAHLQDQLNRSCAFATTVQKSRPTD